MGTWVIFVGYHELQALDQLKGEAQHQLALHGTIFSIVGFHFVWACGTLTQIPMAYAIREKVGDEYVEMLKARYKIPLMIIFADIAYFGYFTYKFWSIFQ
jgi:hypothetical protein